MRYDHQWHRARTRTFGNPARTRASGNPARTRTSGGRKILGGIGALLLSGVGIWLAVERPTRPSPPEYVAAGAQARFDLCGSARRVNCVVDGDTFWMAGEKIRIADIDTPETHPARCDTEAVLGERATLRLQALLNDGAVTMAIADRDTDRYGRKLRVVSRRGVSVGDILIAEGLAREWTGRRQPWCA